MPSFFSLSSSKLRILLIRCGVYSRAAFIGNFVSIRAFDRERRFLRAAFNRILYYRKLRLHEISR